MEAAAVTAARVAAAAKAKAAAVAAKAAAEAAAGYKVRNKGKCGDSGDGWGRITTPTACAAGFAALPQLPRRKLGERAYNHQTRKYEIIKGMLPSTKGGMPYNMYIKHYYALGCFYFGRALYFNGEFSSPREADCSDRNKCICAKMDLTSAKALPDGSYRLPKTSLRNVVLAWISGGAAKADVVAKYGPIESWDTSEMTDLAGLFYGARNFTADISKWNVSSVTNLDHTFVGATVFNADLSKWDVSSVTSLEFTFNGASSFNADLSKWDVSSVTTLASTFTSAKAFNADLSQWVVSSVTSLSGTFQGASSFNADLSQWDVSSVTQLFRTFNNAKAFNADLSQWDVSSVFTFYQTFYRATVFNADLSQWDVSSARSNSVALRK